MRIRSAGQLVVAAALTAGALTGVSPAGAAPTSAEVAAEAKAALNCAPIDQGSIIRLYKAYFLRDPDAGGIAYWSFVLRSGQSDLAGIAQYFSTSAEFQARYSNLTDSQFVSLVYNNVMSRPPDQAGLDYWTQLLASKRLTRGLVMLSFSESPEFKERVGIWPAPPAAGDTKLLPQSVPVTMHPGRIAEMADSDGEGVYLEYQYPSSVSLPEIFGHTIGQFQCPGWEVLDYDDQPAGGEMGILVRGRNGLIMDFGAVDISTGRFGYVIVTYDN